VSGFTPHFLHRRLTANERVVDALPGVASAGQRCGNCGSAQAFAVLIIVITD
jgi:hypothetical protein